MIVFKHQRVLYDKRSARVRKSREADQTHANALVGAIKLHRAQTEGLSFIVKLSFVASHVKSPHLTSGYFVANKASA